SEGYWQVIFFYPVFFDWPRTRGTCQGVCPHGVYVATDWGRRSKTGNYGFTGHIQCLFLDGLCCGRVVRESGVVGGLRGRDCSRPTAHGGPVWSVLIR